MAYENLVDLDNGAFPDNALSALRAASFRTTMNILRQQAAFDQFHESCVLASRVEYAYFKGAAFAASFYANPMQRYFRDVDILIPARSRTDLIRCMLDQGCTVVPKTDADKRVFAKSTDADLKQYLSLCSMPGMLTPQGLLVEIHDTPDNKTYLFSTDAMLARAEMVRIRQQDVRVLPLVPHIVFSLYHHSTHLWSKLNWVADIDAICTHPSFDRDEVLYYSRKLGIEASILAAFELRDLTGSARLPEDFAVSTAGVDFLHACVEGLAGDVPLEKTMRRYQRMDALSFDWQPNPIPMWKFVWRRLVNYKPQYSDFMLLPGGVWFRYAAGIVIGLVRSAHRRIAQAMER